MKNVINCFNSSGEYDLELLKKHIHSPCDEKDKILDYLKKRSFVKSASTGRITDELTGEKVENYCSVFYSDGEYEWDSYDIYYIERYDVSINSDFIEHVLAT